MSLPINARPAVNSLLYLESLMEDEIKRLIEEGLDNIGTDEETVLFSDYAAGDISLTELYVELAPIAVRNVNEIEASELIYAK